MDLQQARATRDNSASAPRVDLARALDFMVRQYDKMAALYDKMEALSLEQERLRTLGGIPPKVDKTWAWANERLVPLPASASDPSAPPLWRGAPRLARRPDTDGPRDAA
jgi:hypothetical protein